MIVPAIYFLFYSACTELAQSLEWEKRLTVGGALMSVCLIYRDVVGFGQVDITRLLMAVYVVLFYINSEEAAPGGTVRL